MTAHSISFCHFTHNETQHLTERGGRQLGTIQSATDFFGCPSQSLSNPTANQPYPYLDIYYLSIFNKHQLPQMQQKLKLVLPQLI